MTEFTVARVGPQRRQEKRCRDEEKRHDVGNGNSVRLFGDAHAVAGVRADVDRYDVPGDAFECLREKKKKESRNCRRYGRKPEDSFGSSLSICPSRRNESESDSGSMPSFLMTCYTGCLED